MDFYSFIMLMKIIPYIILILVIVTNTSFMPDSLSMLCLGDSYTIGEAVAEDERFPMQTVALLHKIGAEVSKPKIIAKTGWTTDELMNAVKADADNGTYELVTLLIGVNNQYRGRSIAEYKIQFQELLKTAIRFSGNRPERVFVLSIPDWGVTPFALNDKRGASAISRQIDEYNACNKTVSFLSGVHYIDVTPSSRKAVHQPDLLAHDGLHPSGKMYAEWAALLSDEIKKEINR